jgi:hypothetical protein
MKRAAAITGIILLAAASPAIAHRVDEYLQATTLLVSSGRLQLDMRLVPGAAVVATVLDSIDTDRDTAISDAEGQAYGQRVLSDLSLTLDGDPVALQLVASRASTVDEMQRGLGEIQLAFEAELPQGGPHRRLVFENRHRRAIAAYLVNGLVPEERGIRITDQVRNYQQSVYEMTYEQGATASTSVSFGSVLRWGLVCVALVAVLVDQFTSLVRRRGKSAVRCQVSGVRH